uniref:transmembrane protein 95 isoform X2 n=1 Tax=Halichoerus grypus TaxID=9711 RepID=UPI0016596587|nr:transmembrane protein 95 isoform X2 [Halichoerus grypus]
MWMLALGGVFLATAQACVLCHLSARDLSGRLAQLCSRVEVLWKDCGASWSFPAFALGKLRHPETGRATVATTPRVGQPVASQLGPSAPPESTALSGHAGLSPSGENHRSLPVSTDEASMNKVIEKTHRVLRVMEIKGSLSSLPLYWRWLQNTRLPAYTREALCAPACRGSTILYNCSTCQEFKVRCWPRKRCLPGSHDLREAKILLLSVLVAALLLGVISLVVESSYMEAERTSEDPDSLPASSSSKDHDESTSLGEDQPAP